MKIRKGDTVKIIGGASRGKTGKVLQVFRETARITVEGVNIRKKHTRPKRQGQKGQKIEFPAPLAVSNAMLVCPKCGKPTRIASNSADGKKQRMCKKCAQIID